MFWPQSVKPFWLVNFELFVCVCEVPKMCFEIFQSLVRFEQRNDCKCLQSFKLYFEREFQISFSFEVKIDRTIFYLRHNYFLVSQSKCLQLIDWSIRSKNFQHGKIVGKRKEKKNRVELAMSNIFCEVLWKKRRNLHIFA